VCGLQKNLAGTFGVKLTADITIDEVNVDEYEALAIPGGFAEYDFYKEAYHDKFLALIRAFHEKNKTVASICVGALPVGKSGILKGKRGTTYNKGTGVRQATLREYGVDVINQPIVETDNIITSWNPSTAMDVAFMLLERLTSKEQAGKIRDLMGFARQV
jgi:4-methyl-5(b-hydroxyethyl)-thiazole monophosphate biosynthesis